MRIIAPFYQVFSQIQNEFFAMLLCQITSRGLLKYVPILFVIHEGDFSRSILSAIL